MGRTARPGEEDRLRSRLRRHLRTHPELIPDGSRAVVAVSGGPDSMALLDLLDRLSRERDTHAPGSLIAAHFDHGLRPESTREARKVIRWCRGRGVPWVAAGPAEPLSPDPAACRRARYRFLEGVVDGAGADRLVTAHHADDQAETILFRILRGTDVAGLRGMVPLNGRLARPLLPFRKEELVAYARRRGLPYHEDPANRDRAFARSHLRHRLLPALESRDSAVREKLRALGRRAARAEEAMASLTDAALSACRMISADGAADDVVRLSLGRLRALDGELQARILRRVARAKDVRLSRGGTRSAVQFITDGRSGGRVDLGDGLRLGRDFDVLWIGRTAEARGEDRPVSLRLPGSGTAATRIGGASYRISWGRGRPGPTARGGLSWRVASPPPPGQLELCVRGWNPGDRVRLDAGTRKLKDVFVDRRVPRSLRRRLPVLAEAPETASGSRTPGRVLWVPGLCRAADVGEPDPGAGAADDSCWVIITGTGQLAPGAA